MPYWNEMPTCLKKNGHGFLPTPRPLSSPHLKDNATHTPDINLGVVAFLVRINNFWCHPKDSALHGGERLHVYVISTF